MNRALCCGARSLVPVWPALTLLVFCWGCGPHGAGRWPDRIECEGLTLILVPQGQRIIGTSNSRAEPNERPACLYRMNKVLYMGQTEVTAGQYRRFLPGWPMLFEDAEPAIVSWHEANRFCVWFQERLEEATGRKWHCRLQTEAEWEYAARYGRPPGEDWWPVAWDEYWHGPNALMDLAWFSRNSDRKWHPVAQKMPNPLGLYDMLGNADEWCAGWLTTSVETMIAEDGKPDDQYDQPSLLDPEAEMKYRSRPARGGSFSCPEDDCRPSRRYPGSSCSFRIVALPRR